MCHFSLLLSVFHAQWCNVRTVIAPIALLFSMGFSTSSMGEELPTPFEFFDRNCLTPGPHFDAMVTQAAGSNWSPLPEQVLRVLTPIENPSALMGWIASGDDAKIKVVVVSRGAAGPKLLEGCTVGFYGVDTRAFEKATAGRAGPGADGKRDTPNRVNHIFKATSADGVPEFVTLSLPETVEGPDQVIATVLAEGIPDK